MTLAEHHSRRLCYPFTDVPAFMFWEPPTGEPLPPGVCPMRAWQDGRCGLCGFRDALVEDHCHETGLVRGMVCRSCNTADGRGSGRNLGKWRSGTTVAAHLGIEVVYVNAFGETPLRARPTADSDLDLIADAVTR